MHGDEYDVLNPLRDDRTRGSFRINVTSGEWGDFATDLRGKSPISLYAQFFCDGNHPEAAKQIARQIGMLHDAPPDPAIAKLIENLKTKPVEDLFCQRIGFRVHRCIIKWRFGRMDAQKARALGKSSWTEPRYF